MNSYNSEVYWGWEALISASQDNIVINWFWLQNEYVTTSIIEEDNIIDFTSFDFPKNNGRWLLWYYWRWKRIRLKINIRWDDATDFNNRLDEFRKSIFQSEVNLDIKVNWVVRRIKATCVSSPKVLDFFNITFLNLEVEFETLEPYFYELSYQTSAFLNKTTDFNEEIFNNWTTWADILIYFLFKTWLTWVNDISVTIWSKTINITETIDDNDVLLINWETKEVLLNWSIVDYNWEFPVLEVNSNIINFEINWTYDVDINVLNKVLYV